MFKRRRFPVDIILDESIEVIDVHLHLAEINERIANCHQGEPMS